LLGMDTLLADLMEKYAWTSDVEAWTVAVVEARPAQDVIRIYGGDPADPVGEYYFAQARDLQGGSDSLKFHVQTIELDNHIVAIENNGWTGSVPEIARRCSEHNGRFFSVYWNVNAFGILTQAINGRITAYFESLYPIAPEPPQPGEIRPTWAMGQEIEPESAWRACLALMEQQTGLAFDPQWLNEPLPTYRIPDPDVMLSDVEGARTP
jgi:hypothetical protein